MRNLIEWNEGMMWHASNCHHGLFGPLTVAEGQFSQPCCYAAGKLTPRDHEA